MPILDIQLLGGCQLVYDRKRLTAVNSPRLRTLLTYLLLHAGIPQPRQQIAFVLWPDSREAQARNSLRNLLHQLRHALPVDEAFIQADDELVLWRTEANYRLDMAAFERFIAQATSLDETATRQALEQAVAL